MPPLNSLTIPEQDDRAPEEDWTAGLPIIARGIQFQDWKEVADGIILSLEQTENYERANVDPKATATTGTIGMQGSVKRLRKPLGKWMPEELVALAETECEERVLGLWSSVLALSARVSEF